MDATKIAIRASTQDHLDIEDIRDDIVVLKDGSCCVVIAVTSINFDLLSEQEQEATIYAYAALLNSLSFSIQIVIHSQQKDVSSYLKYLDQVGKTETRAAFRKYLQKYRQFVEETVQKNNVLDKRFYLVIPMSTLELGAVKSIVSNLNPQKRKLPYEKDYILERAKINLYPKRDHILRQLGRLGIKGKQLDTKELIKLFFDLYNPESPGQEIEDIRQYEAPIIQSTMAPLPKETSQTTEEKPKQETVLTPPATKPQTDTSPIPSPIPTAPAPLIKGKIQTIFSPSNNQKNTTQPESIQDEISNLVKQSVK